VPQAPALCCSFIGGGVDGCSSPRRDNGPGIPAIEHKAVTRRFYRLDKTGGSEGQGLGLSLVAAIVKLHRFRFTLAPGPGCTAEISCPTA
jgi:signal transduction histidine kinase